MPRSGHDVRLSQDAIRDVMWRFAGLFRTRERLEEAVTRLEAADTAERRAVDGEDPAARPLLNLLTVAKLIAGAALRREESRGGHFRADFPETNDLDWKVHLVDQEGDV
jgi:L-aspartate oxidase